MSSRTEIPALRLLRMVPLARVLGAAAAGAAAELSAVALMATATWLIARAAGKPPLAVLALAIVGVRVFALSRGGLRYLERLTGHHAALSALAVLRERTFAALERLAPAGTAALRGGDALQQLIADVDAVSDLLIRCLLPAAVALVVGAATVTFLTAVLPMAGAVVAGGLILAATVPAATYLRARLHIGQLVNARVTLTTRSLDLVEGAAELAAFGAAPTALAAATAAARRLTRLHRATARLEGIATAVVLAIQGATALAVTLFALHGAANHILDPVLVPVLAFTALTAFEAITPLPAAAVRFVEINTAARRLAAVANAPAPVAEPAHPLPLHPGPVTIELRGVIVRYAPDRPLALNGFNLRLDPGRRVALVGASGSGKSTVLATLQRFIDIEAGTFTINGHDVRALAAADVRRCITGATQDTHLFHATLRENLLLARPGATDAELTDATRRAHLLDWITSLPEGLDTVVGRDGARLSGGQRQRLVLAQALLADPDVLILDEPLEGLDPPTSAALLAETLEATRGRTMLLVTHCLTGLDAIDEIIVLDAGHVIQRGHHSDLLTRPGRYRDLCNAQRTTAAIDDFQVSSTGGVASRHRAEVSK